MYDDYIQSYLEEVREIADRLDRKQISRAMEILHEVRESGGRLFILGIGGGAGHASHAVNDFRKLANIEAYTPVDNVSEITARTNDNGFRTIFSDWLVVSKIRPSDAVLVFSVGGGSVEKEVSINLVDAMDLAKRAGAKIIAVVGRDGGYAKKVADACIMIPVVNPGNVTPHTEAFQAVVWHMMVSHPKFQSQQGKWESIQTGKQ